MRRKGKEKIKEIKKKIREEYFFNVPNIFTLARLLFASVVIYMLFNNYSKLSIGIVFIIGALTDWVDGYFARRSGKTTEIGARFDQVIDRIFTLTIVIALGIFFVIHKEGNLLFLFLLLSREIIATPGFIIRIIRNKDAYRVKYIGKLTTFIQSIAIAMLILEINWFGLNWSLYSVIATCILGIIAGFDYLKDSVI